MRYSLLDSGYVEMIEYWGSDERIIESARMSTGKGFKGWGTEQSPGDERLLRYLYSHKHMTPFEMAGMTIEVQAPIIVFREWHRHRTQSYNELSARYTPLPAVDYSPTVDRCMGANDTNKQASTIKGAAVLTADSAAQWLLDLSSLYDHCQSVYEDGLNAGIPKELARLAVPVARYSRMRASANLRNWLQFLTLRMDSAAQWEIRQYANTVGSIIRALFPRTWELFIEH